MGQNVKKSQEDDAAGAPEWMVTFSDCMTLLLTFFVLLLSFSSFDNKIFRKLKVIYSKGLTTIMPINRSNRDSLTYIPPIIYDSDLDEGSEKPTMETGNEDGLSKSAEPYNLDRGIVLSLPSNKLFWGKGTAISNQGQNTIDTIAQFLAGVSHRIVISEHGPSNDTTGGTLGLQRAWAVMNYLTTKKNIDKNRFSISAISTISQTGVENANQDSGTADTGRTVEIVLLARNIYN
jgi:chemotaxis protein MotB